ncbi:hypothetical protein [Aliarcobacter skirrowii]|uniref:hypothetical protein n=1 Tax=Aliarcobacter skirrowii TaxID=28200 RepID=UPI0013E98735|nr:hypothetical protein [Aliarcobacter skirrowii]
MTNEAIKLQVQKKIKEILLKGGLSVEDVEVTFKLKDINKKRTATNGKYKNNPHFKKW